MPRRNRYRPNWPYRFAWLTIVGLIVAYIAIGTLVSVGGVPRGHGHRDWSIALVSKCLDATFAVWFMAVGASIGSFLNVVAYRLPLGRTLGGHSACPFCCNRILGKDNVPVLAWLRLRGRCRECHLPISPQYPLVELAVALVYLFVYMTEFSIAGDNLPGAASGRQGFGFVWTNITEQVALRTLLHLFVVSGLIGAALIAVHRQTVPVKLYVWVLAILTAGVFLKPGLAVVPWWPGTRGLSDFDLRLNALVTVLCGLVAGIAIARMLAPLLFQNMDGKLLSADPATVGARQWMGAMGVAGAAVGWQAVVLVAGFALICQLVGLSILRILRRALNDLVRPPARQAGGTFTFQLADSTVWVWCGLLLLRASWKWIDRIELPGMPATTVYWYLVGVSMLAPVCWCIGLLSREPLSSNSQAFDQAETNNAANDAIDDSIELPNASDHVQNST